MLTSPVRDEYIIAGDLTFHYVQWGAHGPPLIFAHGITANAFCFQAMADALSNDFRVYAYDLRGRGDSDKPETGYSIPIHAQDLAEIIDALELDRPVVVGHSLGAFIAQQFAATYPEKLSKLILIDGGGRLPWSTLEEQPAWLTASFARLGVPVVSFPEYLQRFKMAPFLGPYWNEYVDTYLDHDVYRQSDGSVISKGYPAGIREDQMSFFELDFRPEALWPKVTVPTLLMRAGQGLFTESDQLLPEAETEAMQRHIRKCHYVNYPGLNHYTIIFGVSEAPASEIGRFVREEE